VSDLGQFDFGGLDGEGFPCLRLTSYHPGRTIELIKSRTGFDFQLAPDIHETQLPSDQEINLLRFEIDPLGIRQLESLSGASRRKLLHQIILSEKNE
jgi:hypothetical protein